MKKRRFTSEFKLQCVLDILSGRKNPIEDPIQVGIHAIGTTGLRGGYKASETATRFDYFRLLK